MLAECPEWTERVEMKLSRGRIAATVGVAVAAGTLVVGGIAFADHGSSDPSAPPAVGVDDHGRAGPSASESEGPDDSGHHNATGVDNDENHRGRGAGHPED